MNAETVLQIRTEAFSVPPNPCYLETRTYPAFIDLTHLSNRQFNECSECCKDQVDYACSASICYMCGHATIYGRRYRCFLCHKVFHETCRNNPELASSTGRWMCLDCKCREKQNSSTFMHRIPNTITVAYKNFQMATINAEQYAGTDCGSDRSDRVACTSANSNLIRGITSATNNEPANVSPKVEPTTVDCKDDIVDKVAKGFLQRMTNTGKMNICHSVPSNHFGPIPGIPVGTCWKYRLQVAEAGIHRPLVAGIHGRFKDGACSIVLSGAYPEDTDFGEEFYYSGCGGRDPYNKRLKVQTRDQTLTRLNRALALSCNAPFNDQIGAEAIDWQGGKPVRVVRNYKLRKHSIYAPVEGNRYDGIYKVVKYFPAIGPTGLVVWRYLLRRDDPEPAPWTDEGKRIIEEKNLRVIFPCGYHENQQMTIKKEKVEHPPSKKMAYDCNNSNRVAKMEPYDPSYLQSYPPANPTPAPACFPEEVDIKPNVHVLQASLLQPQPNYNHPYNCNRPATDIRAPVDVPAQCPPNFQLNISSVKSLNPSTSSDSTTSAAQFHPAALSNPASDTAVPVPPSNAPNAASDTAVPVPPNNAPNPASDTAVPVPPNNVLNVSAPANNVGGEPACANNEVSHPLPISNNFCVDGITIKEEPYDLPASTEKLIDLDTANETIWAYCKMFLGKTEKEFLDVVRLMFLCRNCCKVVDHPITTPCHHNICLNCLSNHFSQSQFSCPDCCYSLGSTFTLTENTNLASALEKLFSGCNAEYLQSF